MIDPALTTMNGPSSDNLQHYSPPPNYSTPQYGQPQLARQHSQTYQSNQHNQQPLSINPSALDHSSFLQYFQNPQSQQQQQQQHQQPHVQGTLSPHALHQPHQSIMPPIMPTSFYTPDLMPQASTSQPVNPQVRIDKFQAALKSHLLPNSFNGAGSVGALTSLILEYGPSEVTAQTRLEILTKIRDNAGNHYFRAWSESPTAIEITRGWLKAGATADSGSPLVETIMPLLHVSGLQIADRLPLTLETLKTSGLGKIVVKLSKDPPAPAIKDMAQNIQRRWRLLLPADGVSKTPETEAEKSKKRKPTEPPPSKAPPPAKKAAVSGVKAVAVKKEAKVGAPAVKDAKSDSSFFSAPKPKPKLPSFKKAPVAAAKKEEGNIAQPSSIDPFQEALKSMKAKRESPAVSTPPPTASRSGSVSGSTKPVKKRKSVTWRPEAELEQVRFIEKAIYDDDPADGSQHASLQELDRGEGAALHAHLFEEAIDWTEPLPIDIPDSVNSEARGAESQEKGTQEEREQTALGALYMSTAQIPDSPAEPSHTIPDEEVDVDVKKMDAGEEANAIFGSVAPTLAPMASVADLMGQLTNGTVDPAASQYNAAAPFNVDPNLLPMMQNLAPDKIQQMLQQLMGPAMQQQQQAPYGGVDQTWNQDQYADYGRNGCKFGDQCDFSHEF
ncbi:hypothetical protein HWV62_28976 [Athelia sp. TMB]|nr:hypothetical protein HWV62_28976 [Athelia sp. TMB]